MKLILNSALVLTLFLLVIIPGVKAQEEKKYTKEDVAQHSSKESCYSIFENKVYDITEYLQKHEERFMPIDQWCGIDMTDDFKDKAGAGRDHTGGYSVLEGYYIGDLDTSNSESEDLEDDDSTIRFIALGLISITFAGALSYFIVKRS